jgi:hypothetical protein
VVKYKVATLIRGFMLVWDIWGLLRASGLRVGAGGSLFLRGRDRDALPRRSGGVRARPPSPRRQKVSRGAIRDFGS